MKMEAIQSLTAEDGADGPGEVPGVQEFQSMLAAQQAVGANQPTPPVQETNAGVAAPAAGADAVRAV
jgi:hypothetical protein